MASSLRIATRGSPLALWQANHIADLIRPLIDPRPVELVEIRTTGDVARNDSLAVIGGQGVFTKEIQQAILAGQADVAVHSLKDLPTVPVPGLVLAAVPPRGSTADVLISHRHKSFDALPKGAKIATGSSRRRAQILDRRPDLNLVDIRGNVETRLRKLDEQELDGVILAQAGMERLNLDGQITEVLDQEWMVPAVGQGALGVECRSDDEATWGLLYHIDHMPSRQAVLAERAFLRALGGGCMLPIAANALIRNQMLSLRGVVLSPDGRRKMAGAKTGSLHTAEAIGGDLASELLSQGAAELLE